MGSKELDARHSGGGRAKTIAVLKGGFGEVHICQSDNWIFVLKSFQEKYIRDDKVVEDFYREAEIWLKLGEHKNIVHAIDIIAPEFIPVIMMEYVDGGSLKEKLEKERLSISEALDIAIQFCDGMIYANNVDLGGGRRGIVHRDIKQSNIMLTKEGVVKITDFGLVKVLGTPTVENPVGTPEYMSPEQFETMDVDTRADIYSFGVVLYEMLTGRLPFNTEVTDIHERWPFYEYHHRKEKPVPPGQINPQIPKELESVVLKCLEKQPRLRYQSFAQLREELVRIHGSRYGGAAKATETESTPIGILYLRGDAFMSIGRYEDALECSNKVLEKHPRDAGAWELKGRALNAIGHSEDAIECYDRALGIEQRLGAWIGKGMALLSLRKGEDALKCFEEALKIQEHRNAWFGKGMALSSLGRHEEALKCFDSVLKTYPTDIASLVGMGTALSSLGRYQDAIWYFTRALEINPRQVGAWTGVGVALYRQGKPEQALECLDRAIEIDPRYAWGWAHKGIALQMLGRRDEASTCFNRAIQIDPRAAEMIRSQFK